MFIIIPAKPFSQSKTRLAGILSTQERSSLSQRLLHRTLMLACHIGDVVVISRDQQVRRQAKQQGAWALVESGANLNTALKQAIAWVLARGGQTVLILPADLPLLTLVDLREMTQLGQHSPGAVIAPCHRGDGTNALLIFPPNLILPEFGINSFRRHCKALTAAGVEPIIYRSPTLSFDLDLPADLFALQQKLSL